MAQHPPSGPVSPHYRGFTVTLRNITLGRTPLDKWSTWRRDFHLTAHNTHKDICSGGIRTRNPGKRAAADPRFRPRGRWDRLSNDLIILTRLGEEYKLQSSSIFSFFFFLVCLWLKHQTWCGHITREVLFQRTRRSSVLWSGLVIITELVVQYSL